MKVLVTGDREWNDVETIVSHLEKLPPGTIIVHGACRGADNACKAVAESLGLPDRAYPADWTKNGKAAGVVRNQLMITKEHVPHEPIDLCLAFHNNIDASRGTRDMISRAAKVGIPIKLITTPSV